MVAATQKPPEAAITATVIRPLPVARPLAIEPPRPVNGPVEDVISYRDRRERRDRGRRASMI